MSGISRAKFHADLLPRLDTVRIGSRHFVVVKPMDRLIAELKAAPTPRCYAMPDAHWDWLRGAITGVRQGVRTAYRARAQPGIDLKIVKP
jgi:hypothetical protein